MELPGLAGSPQPQCPGTRPALRRSGLARRRDWPNRKGAGGGVHRRRSPRPRPRRPAGSPRPQRPRRRLRRIAAPTPARTVRDAARAAERAGHASLLRAQGSAHRVGRPDPDRRGHRRTWTATAMPNHGRCHRSGRADDHVPNRGRDPRHGRDRRRRTRRRSRRRSSRKSSWACRVEAPDFADWLSPNAFDPAGHPLEAAGIRTDKELRPVDPSGKAPLENVGVAGSLLAGQRYLRERCRDGVAIASGRLRPRTLSRGRGRATARNRRSVTR